MAHQKCTSQTIVGFFWKVYFKEIFQTQVCDLVLLFRQIYPSKPHRTLFSHKKKKGVGGRYCDILDLILTITIHFFKNAWFCVSGTHLCFFCICQLCLWNCLNLWFQGKYASTSIIIFSLPEIISFLHTMIFSSLIN